ncbi:four-carbon acid sugar kinase family protein [Variovorax sp. J22P271]|uniref:four-carbon acid sugar kinase family protein n=1 Tax=Variovorax davisae TaxID=3053515 RepID=UPI00257906F4|nr:four-carbon acid sugar kinase family protein [Variovorax sp. J22P271]MDM0034344.1 four-carbon acid sugar kinase family protein [Variovorax sp. J22P271]
MNSPPLLYYGDDFTGATDALATAARAGLRSLLLFEAPDAPRLAALGALDCLGIAGAARAMNPQEMRDELAPIAALARRIAPRVLHYKTCSTFDSAPDVGSIGEAIRLLRPAMASDWVALLGGQPNLGRHCLFGNLFAAAGSGGEVFRIDRHPTMSRHPVTPMHEADLRRHLSQQGIERIGLVPWTLYGAGAEAVAARLAALRSDGARAVLFDVAEAGDLSVIGQALWRNAAQAPLLAVGPSSVTEAVARSMPARGASVPERIEAARGPVLVLAGSLSPVTARQVEAARSYDIVRLDASRLVEADGLYRASASRDLSVRLAAGRHVLACTVSDGGAPAPVPARELARCCGLLLAQTLTTTPVLRLGIAGGDTSSLGVRALDAWGLSYAGLVAPGAPLCRLHSESRALDGMEVMLKGGQMGGVDLFERLVHGTGG